MPVWADILHELDAVGNNDVVRRKYLLSYSNLVGRDVIVYASGWLEHSFSDSSLVSVTDSDLTGLMQSMHGLKRKNLDLFLHSPGGEIAAAEAFVHYLRSKFTHVRAIVPQYALSAATMIACACDRIVMGKHSILAQFDLAKEECKNSDNVAAYIPMLEDYGPDMLVYAKNSIDLSELLVEEWLRDHMFKRDKDGAAKAKRIAGHLCAKEHKQHDRRIPRQTAIRYGLKVERLERNQEWQDAALSVFHATTLTMMRAGVGKLIENHIGGIYVRYQTQVEIPFPIQFQPQMVPQPPVLDLGVPALLPTEPQQLS